MTTPCSPLILPPETSPCIHGICNPITNNTCLCDEITWSSAGDMRFSLGLACDVHLPSLTALWIITLIIYVLPLSISVRHFIIIGSRQSWKRAFNLKLPVVKIHVSIIIVSCLWLLTSILKLIDITKYCIGLNEGYTWLFWIAAVSTWILLWACGNMYTNLFLATQMKMDDYDSIHQQITWLRIIITTSHFCLILGDCALLVGYYLPSTSEEVLMCFFFVSAIGVGVAPMAGSYIFTQLIEQMKLVVESPGGGSSSNNNNNNSGTTTTENKETMATRRVKDLIIWLSRINVFVILTLAGFVAIQSFVFGSLAITRRSSLPYNTPILLITGGFAIASFARAGSNIFAEPSNPTTTSSKDGGRKNVVIVASVGG
jgi:hypothetical protein